MDRTNGITEATRVAKKMRCGFVMLGNGKFALVDKGDVKKLNALLWSCAARGYAVHCCTPVKGKPKNPLLYMHRFILGLKPEDHEVDHRNRNRLDNRRCNPRLATSTQQRGNIPKKNFKKKPTSRFKGVSFSREKGKWLAQGRVKEKGIFLGRFDDERAAAIRYNQWATSYFGEFAYLNPV